MFELLFGFRLYLKIDTNLLYINVDVVQLLKSVQVRYLTKRVFESGIAILLLLRQREI